jgi:two-component system OmpR family response regulator
MEMKATTTALPRSAADAPLTAIDAHQETILIVDDDPEIRALVAEQLESAGYGVIAASDGPTMLAALETRSVNLVVLDLSLPGEDGLSLCRRIRSNRDLPIIMLTARSEAIDRVIGLEVGADDYISKPFEPRELTARVRSVLRRAYHPLKPLEAAPPKRAMFRGWTLEFENRRLIGSNGRVVLLSGSEYSLLKFLVEHANEVLTREQLLMLTAEPDQAAHSAQRIADLQISRLRQKLHDSARASELIMTVRGQGYVLAAAVTFE